MEQLNRLGAVGQMAFTNYLMHTVICTLVAAIWVLQLIVSPIWLRHFQFGPLEWVWRSLTYWKMQPMKR